MVVVVEGTRTVLTSETVAVTVFTMGAVTVTGITIVLVDADVPV